MDLPGGTPAAEPAIKKSSSSGKYFDCYSPSTNNLDRIRSEMSSKVKKKKQADRIVVNLDDTKATPDEVRNKLLIKPIDGLAEVIAIKNGKAVHILP